MQADAFGGYDGIYATGNVVEVACWAHVRRKFYEARTSDAERSHAASGGVLYAVVNGYVLEQVLSPLVVHTTPEHDELKEIAVLCITRHHAHHYLGFAETQWKLFEKENPPRVKPLLYVYRVLLTGIHLMQTGTVEVNLVRLNETAKLPYLDELIQRKIAGAEKERLSEADVGFHQGEYDRLRAITSVASASSGGSRHTCRKTYFPQNLPSKASSAR